MGIGLRSVPPTFDEEVRQRLSSQAQETTSSLMTIRSIDFGLLADQGDELARHAAVEYLVFSDLSSDHDSLDQDSRAPSSSSHDSSAQAWQRDTWLDSTESLSQSGVSGVSSSLNDIRADFRVGATLAQGGMGSCLLYTSPSPRE